MFKYTLSNSITIRILFMLDFDFGFCFRDYGVVIAYLILGMLDSSEIWIDNRLALNNFWVRLVFESNLMLDTLQRVSGRSQTNKRYLRLSLIKVKRRALELESWHKRCNRRQIFLKGAFGSGRTGSPHIWSRRCCGVYWGSNLSLCRGIKIRYRHWLRIWFSYT